MKNNRENQGKDSVDSVVKEAVSPVKNNKENQGNDSVDSVVKEAVSLVKNNGENKGKDNVADNVVKSAGFSCVSGKNEEKSYSSVFLTDSSTPTTPPTVMTDTTDVQATMQLFLALNFHQDSWINHE